mmetsp:Transcript_11961/g.36443  ORF Transcript_11961/g.36443 Transcript_11961/m.36443 type:complete len:201 (-) Transcript_11961:14-616(-)
MRSTLAQIGGPRGPLSRAPSAPHLPAFPARRDTAFQRTLLLPRRRHRLPSCLGCLSHLERSPVLCGSDHEQRSPQPGRSAPFKRASPLRYSSPRSSSSRCYALRWPLLSAGRRTTGATPLLSHGGPHRHGKHAHRHVIFALVEGKEGTISHTLEASEEEEEEEEEFSSARWPPRKSVRAPPRCKLVQAERGPWGRSDDMH